MSTKLIEVGTRVRFKTQEELLAEGRTINEMSHNSGFTCSDMPMHYTIKMLTSLGGTIDIIQTASLGYEGVVPVYTTRDNHWRWNEAMFEVVTVKTPSNNDAILSL